MTTQELEYLIKVNDRDLRELKSRVKDTNKALGDETEQASKKGSRGIGKLGKAAKFGALGLGAAAGGLAWAAKIGFDEFREGEKVAAQTSAVLKSTGGAAKVSAKEVSELASSIGDYSTLGDEAVQEGENLLLTFTNLKNEAGKGNDIFTQTTRIMADMSIALGQDTKSSAIQLGKALNDPVKGVTALQRVGVSFTAAQREQIKALVESGNTMGAQKLILAELNKEFGGSAKAAGETFGGQITRAKNKVEDFLGEAVARLIPELQKVVAWTREHWPEISAVILQTWETIKPTLDALIALAVEVVATIREHWGSIGPIVERVADLIQNGVEIITDALQLVTALLRGDWSAAWTELKSLVGNVFEQIVNLVQLAGTTLKTVLRGIGTGMKNALVAGLTGLAGAVWDLINNIPGVIADNAGKIASWGRGVGADLKSAAVGGITGLAGDVWDVVNNIPGVLKDNAGKIASWGAELGGAIKDAALGALKGLGTGITNLVRSAINAVIRQINGLLEFSIDIPNRIPGLPNEIRIDAPDIPELAAGGLARAGRPVIVGEQGPELFVPDRTGQVIPNHRLAGGTGAGLFAGATFIVRSELEAELVGASVSSRLVTLAPA